MSYTFPKIQLTSSLDIPDYYNASPTYPPQNQFTGNTIVGSPARYSSPYSNKESDSSPAPNHHTLLAMNAYNTLSKRSPYSDRNSISGNFSPMIHPMSPMSPMMMGGDSIMMNGMNSPYHRAPRSPYSYSMGGGGLYDGTPILPMPQLNPVVDDYFDKQNQLMSRILKNVEDYKKMEYMKQKALLEQKLGRLDELDMIAHNLQAQSKEHAQHLLAPERNQYRSRTLAHPRLPETPDYNPSPARRKAPTILQSGSALDDFFPPKAAAPESISLLKPKKYPTWGRDDESDPTQYPVKRPLVSDDESMDLSIPIKNSKRALKNPIVIPPKSTDSKRGQRFSIDENIIKNEKADDSPFKKQMLDTLDVGYRHQQPPLHSNRPAPVVVPEKLTARKHDKARGRKLLKILGWTMATPGIWWMSVAKWAEERLKNELQDMNELVPANLERFLAFAGKEVEKEIKKFALEKNSIEIVLPAGHKKVDLNKRCVQMAKHLTTALDALTVQLSNGKLSEQFFEFLASISEEDSVVSESLISGFELDRLSFNLFGNLKQMDPWKSKMILATFTLLKGYVNFLLVRPWTCIPSIPREKVNMPNLINAGSVFYHIVLEVISDNVPKITKPDPESRPPFTAQKPQFSAVDPENQQALAVVPENDEDNEQEIVSGFYKKEQLAAFLDKRFDLVQQMKESVSDFLGELYTLTHRYYETKKHVKKGFGEHLSK